MKKSSINLLSNKQDYYGLEKKFIIIRRITLLYCVLVFIFGVSFALYYTREQNNLKRLLTRKENLLKEIGTFKDDEAKMSLFAKKLQYFDEFSNEDARFSPYYNLLVSTLNNSTTSAQLSDFKISKDRSVVFVLSFDSVAEALSVFGEVESERFTKNFQSLSLINFTGTNAVNTKYELEFKGIFKKIDTDL